MPKSPLRDRELVEMLSFEPGLLAIADALVATDSERRHFPRQPRAGRSRRGVAALALGISLLVIGTAVAATTDWLAGAPAPPSVVADFGTYAPQLGFHPDSGNSVLVAESGELQLYATTNAEGSYCVVASAPWKRPNTNPDGGYCLPEKTAAQPIVAGIVGGSNQDADGSLTLLVAGRSLPPAPRQ